MAERRMFAKTIVTSDAFLDMPATTRCLYFTLAMFADDDGFVNSPKSIMRQAGASEDDLKILFTKRYILGFESGVIVIKHWKIHNLIQKDRYKETTYLEEKAQLVLDGKKAYTEAIPKMETPCIQSVSKTETQVSVGKGSLELGEDRVVEDSIEILPPKTTKHKYGEYKNVLLTDEDYGKLMAEFPCDYKERIERLSCYIASTGKVYKNHLATIRNWAKRDKEQTKPKAETSSNPFLDMLKGDEQ